MKTCAMCKQSKPLEDFFNDKSSSDGKNFRCRLCWKSIRSERYTKRRDQEIARIQERAKNLREYMKEYKSSLQCIRCGENHPACLDFHHVDSTTKSVNPSEMAGRGWSKERMQQEFDKCIVLCANCHRKEHYAP